MTFQAGDSLQVALAETGATEGEKKSRFKMVANSGQPILNHFWWGNFAIDLEGLQIGKQAKPALRDHNPESIVGWTESISKGAEGITAEGFFTDKTEAGRDALALAQDGFPWQASVYIPPLSIEKLGKDQVATVNGYTLQGPGTIFRKSILREVTFTALGADENTSAVALCEFAGGQSEKEDGDMEFDKLTVEQLRAECPALCLAIETAAADTARLSAVAEEQARAVAILSEASALQVADPAIALGLIKGGVTVAEAKSQLKDAVIAALRLGKSPEIGATPDPENHQAAPKPKNEHEAALAYQAEHEGVSYRDALFAVSRKMKKEAA